MEFFKEINMFGFNFFKAKKGVRINKEEIEEAKKICVNVGKKIDETAGFVNKNKLAEPILRGASKIFNIILFFCGFIFILALLVLIFVNSLITDLASIFVIMLLCRLLIIISLIVAVIIIFIYYAKIKN